MKIGLLLNNQSQLPADLVKNLDGQMAMVRAARDGGWDAFLASMHYLNDGDVVALQQVPLLARLQAEAGDMTMGVAIFLLNLHNPAYTAETMATLDVNLMHAVRTIRAAVPHMKGRDHASIVIVSSISGWKPGPRAQYGAAEDDEILLATSLAWDLAAEQQRGNTVSAGSN